MFAASTRNTEGERVAFNQTSLFVQRAGGFGGRRTSEKSILPVVAPHRVPDVSVHETTSVDQVCGCRRFRHVKDDMQ